MSIYVQGPGWGTTHLRIDSTVELVQLAMREELGSHAIAGDEALRRRIAVLEQMVANLISEVAATQQKT